MTKSRASALREAATDADAGSGVALWRRIADEIERAILTGAFRAGAKLPGEMELAVRFGVNRHTVRRAIAALAERGVVRAERGSGTYVEAQRLSYPIRQRTRFSEIVGGTGRSVDGRLIASTVENATSEVAKRLKLRAGAPVLRLEVLRQADRVPLSAGTTWMPLPRFTGAAEVYAAARSMTKTLAAFGVHDYVRQSTRVSAAIVDEADALRLELAPGRPVLVVDGVDIDRAGVPVLTTHARFSADRIELMIET